jgi:CMP-N-acetylneuraminic acid synthetase
MIINLIIPAKGVSRRIKNKNLYQIGGKSLIYMACEKLLKCKNINKVYLDTESQDVISSVRPLFDQGLHLIKRHPSLATNDIGANEMMIYGLHSIDECDILLQSFCTSPLLSSDTIDRCIQTFVDKGLPKYDSFFTTVDIQEYFWKDEQPHNFSVKELPNSFDLEVLKMETHGLYGITVESLMETKTRVGNKPMLISIPRIESLDVNVSEDLELIERLLDVTK